MLAWSMMPLTLVMAAANEGVPDWSPRDYHINTPLTQDGLSKAVIVSSSRRPAYDALAQQVRSRILELTNIELPVVDAEQATTDEVLAKTNAIVLGNLVTSRFVETLYWEWYTLLDLWYPGKGGHVVRTVHNPYGTGHNVILLGGSEDEGVQDAVEAFCARLEVGGEASQSSDLTVGRFMEIQLGEGHQMPPEGEWIDPRLRIFQLHNGTPLGYSEASRAGLIYHYNGDEAMAQRFRELALETNVLWATGHYNSHMHALIWDLIEESPVFSDDDRRIINENLLEHARGDDGTARRGALLSYDTSRRLLDRHTSMAAVNILVESRYFNKYWPSEEWAQNLAAVRTYFDRQMVTGKGDSDLGGRGIYSYFECAIIPALLMRDTRLVESGALRQYAELLLMHCDNLGYMPDSGQSSYTSYPICTLTKCAALLSDGRFLATMPRRWEVEKAEGFALASEEFSAGQAWEVGIQGAEMKEMIGVSHVPLTQWEWEVRGQSVPFKKSVDKISMRAGFERDDQYLLLDGLQGGPNEKPWPDVNSIVNFGQNSRMFLVSDIGGQNPVNHNTVTVSREGFGQLPGRVASLEALADLPTFGYTHTRAAEHPFTSWDRHIFWRKGKWFVVLDSLSVNEEGRYSFECQWRTIGEPTLGESDYESTVWDRSIENAPRDTLHIKNAEGFPLRHSEQFSGLFGPPEAKRWLRYHPKKSINRLRQIDSRTMDAGDTEIFTNLLYVSGDLKPASYAIRKMGARSALLTGDEDVYLGLLDETGLSRAGVAIRGAAFCVSASSLAVVDATEIQCDGLTITTSIPCAMEVDTVASTITAQSTQPFSITLNAQTRECSESRFSLELPPLAKNPCAQLLAEVMADTPTKPVGEHVQKRTTLPPIPAKWSHDCGAPVLSLSAGDIDGDGAMEHLVGLEDGRALCLDAEGRVQWTFLTGGPVRAVAYGILEQGPTVLVGSDDEHVYALDSVQGDERWKHKCHVPDNRMQIYYWWTTDRKAKLQAILVDDLDGDGQNEVLCGTGGGCVESLNASGQRKWVTPIDWGIPDLFAVVDMPDGTKTLLVDNSWSSCGSTTWRLSAEGKVLTSNACPTHRSSWDMTAVPVLQTADLDGSGAVAIVGREGAYNELGVYDAVSGEGKWLHTLADAVKAVAVTDLDGDGTKEVIAGSPSAWLSAFASDGRQVWATQMPHEIVQVEAVPKGLLVACNDGAVYCVSPDGEAVAKHPMKGLPCPKLVPIGNTVLVADSKGNVAVLVP